MFKNAILMNDGSFFRIKDSPPPIFEIVNKLTNVVIFL